MLLSHSTLQSKISPSYKTWVKALKRRGKKNQTRAQSKYTGTSLKDLAPLYTDLHTLN